MLGAFIDLLVMAIDCRSIQAGRRDHPEVPPSSHWLFLLPVVSLAAPCAHADGPAAKRTRSRFTATLGASRTFTPRRAANGAYGLGYAQAQDRLDDIYISIANRHWAGWRKPSAKSKG